MHGTPPVIADERMKPGSGTTVTGVVSSVEGNTVKVAENLVTLDATNAKITTDRGEPATIGSITVGMTVVAVIGGGTIAPNATLPAIAIAVIRTPDVTLTGPVQTVDVAHNTFTLLGRTIQVNAQTRFGGLEHGNATRGISDLLPNQVAYVQADVAGGGLVATLVQIMSPFPTPATVFHGTVKSIAADQWVITTREGDVTVVVNAQTKIAGSPKVGDVVEVVATVDASHAYVAVSIVKSDLPARVTTVRGKVESIGDASWVIDTGATKVTVGVNAQTKVYPETKVGDTVEILAAVNADGTLTAIVIMRVPIMMPSMPVTQHYRAVVKVIEPAAWVVAVAETNREVKLQITRETKISGNPAVGDRVEVVEVVQHDTHVAISITKL